MRIIHVREVANVASTLVEGLQRLGHEAEVRPMRMRRSDGALEVTGVPSRIIEASRINRYIRRGRFDVVHIHWAYMGWMAIAGRYPYFLHCHGFDLTRNLKWPILGWLSRRAVAQARRVFYSTPDLKPHALRLRSDAAFIPNPIKLEVFRPSEAAHNGRGPRVLMISRFEAKKGPEIAAAVIRQLKSLEPGVQVDAFNWGQLTEALVEPGLVNLIPKVPYSEMPSLLNRYDFVVGQFKLGAIGMSELEAMACGKPVLCFFNYPQVYDEPPPLLSTRDPVQGAEMLVKLIENPQLRKETGDKGRAWVERHHDHIEVARLVEHHYREALGI